MTTIDPILYLDGAFRLTRHGPKAGGTVLVNVQTGEQLDVDDQYTEGLTNNLEGIIADMRDPDGNVTIIWDTLKHLYGKEERHAA